MSDTDKKNRNSSEEDIIDLDEISQGIEAQADAEASEYENKKTDAGATKFENEEIAGSDNNGTGGKKKKKKMKLWKKILLTLLIVIVFLAVAGVAVAYGVFHHYYKMLNVVDPDEEVVETYTGEEDETDYGEDETDNSLSDEEVDEIDSRMAAEQEELNKLVEGETDTSDDDSETLATVDTSYLYNILLIGVDSRSNNFSGRSDMIMLVTINKNSKKIVITSILRDTYVSISGYKNNRINAAYAFGGASLLISTIKQNFGISVDDYVIVNFYTIVSMIDYIGGVSINVTAEEIPYLNSYASGQASLMGLTYTPLSTSDAGTILLDGNQALAYGRIRYVGTDFARTARQRTVALAALNKVKNLSLSSLNTMAETFLPMVKTSLSESDCLSLMSLVLSVGDYTIDTMTIPQDGTWSNATIRKMAVLTVDFTANYKAWLAKVQ